MRAISIDQTGLHPLAPADLKQFLHDSSGMVWIDVDRPDDPVLEELQPLLGLHPLAVEDTRNQRQRPKIEEYPEHLFVIVNTIEYASHICEFHELDIFVGRRYILTVHNRCQQMVTQAQARVGRWQQNGMTPDILLYIMMDTVVDGYFPVLDIIEDEIETLSEVILSEPVENQQRLSHIFTLRRSLTEVWRVVLHQRDMSAALLRHEFSLVPNRSTLSLYLRDLEDHLLHIMDMVNTAREALNSAVELYLTSTSNRLNRVVNRLTIITIVIGIFTVISGFYGMNFLRTWPPFEMEWGVPFVLALMAVVAVVALVVLRRLRMF